MSRVVGRHGRVERLRHEGVRIRVLDVGRAQPAPGVGCRHAPAGERPGEATAVVADRPGLDRQRLLAGDGLLGDQALADALELKLTESLERGRQLGYSAVGGSEPESEFPRRGAQVEGRALQGVRLKVQPGAGVGRPGWPASPARSGSVSARVWPGRRRPSRRSSRRRRPRPAPRRPPTISRTRRQRRAVLAIVRPPVARSTEFILSPSERGDNPPPALRPGGTAAGRSVSRPQPRGPRAARARRRPAGSRGESRRGRA